MLGEVPVIDNIGRYIINFLRTLVETLFSWTESLIFIFDTSLAEILDSLGGNSNLIKSALTLIYGEETASDILNFNLLALIFGAGIIFLICWTIMKWFVDTFL